MNFTNLKIGPRLGMGFAAVLALMLALALTGLNSAQRMHDGVTKILDDNVAKMIRATEMVDAIHIVTRVIRTILILPDEAAKKEQYKKIEAARARYNAAFEELDRAPASAAGKAMQNKIKEAQIAARPLNDKVLELAMANKTTEAMELLMKQAAPASEKWQDMLDEYVERQKERNKTEAQNADAVYSSTLTLISVMAVVALALGVAIAWLITRSITHPLRQAMAVAQRVARGDLTQKITVSSMDETGQLMQALKDMNDSLVKIVSEVRSGTDTIATASGQIASGNHDLSSRTEEQASSLEETASSMEELTGTVQQNAENARQANNLSIAASEVAAKGGAVVSQVVDTMGSINESARKIVDIIGVIDGIAFQTNILALNAAVEAARAGEQGRGFAVVATEVRTLAQRSAGAAKEIKSLIDDSVEKVDAGAKLVDQAGATMQEIVASVTRVTDIIGEITAASQEQSSGIEQINQAITQMDQVTQQNAALVEEAAAASEAMQDQAASLARAVSVFRLDGMQAAKVTAVTAPARSAAPLKKTALQKIVKKLQPTSVLPATAPHKIRGVAASAVAGDEWE
jgi:methyl-accepting chemotaxis protein